MAEFNQNMTQNQIFQEWQENIFDSIEKFQASNSQQKFEIIWDIQSFFQIYLNDLVEQKGALISIDQNIIDFVENKLFDVLNDIKKLEADLGVDTVRWQLTELGKFQILIKFLQHFETIELSEKIQLYRIYQDLNEKSLNFSSLPESKEFKFKCNYRAHTLFLYLSQRWNKPGRMESDEFEIVRYSIIQLLNILDDIQIFDEGDQIKGFILLSHQRINQLLEKHYMFHFHRTKQFTLEVVLKFFKIFKQYQYLLTDCPSLLIQLIVYLLKLGYIEMALQSALIMYELNFQQPPAQVEQLLCFQLLYYCQRKTENSSQNLEQLVEKIKQVDAGQDMQSLQKLLVNIHQLNNLINQQQYKQLVPLIDEIIKYGFYSLLSQLAMLPLVCEAIIFNPNIPNRLNYSKKLLEFCQREIENSLYLCAQREILKYMLSLTISLENNDDQFKEFSSQIKKLIQLFWHLEDVTINREIVKSIIKLNPVIDSLKTYNMQTEIIDILLNSLQKDKENEESKKWIEVLNQQKIQLKQKYDNAQE